MHLCDFSRGMLGAFGLLALVFPCNRRGIDSVVKGKTQVAVSFFWGRSYQRGVFHESLNMAALWKLPVVYVIENNQYALSMPNDLVSAVTDLSSRGCSYGIPGEK